MKVYIKDEVTVPVFKPIKLVVTLESEEEIQELWHRLNIAETLVEDSMDRDKIMKDTKCIFRFNGESEKHLLQPLRFILWKCTKKCIKERRIGL